MERDRIPLQRLREEEEFSSSLDDVFVDGEFKDGATATKPLNENNQPQINSVSSSNDVPLIRAVRGGSFSVNLFFEKNKPLDVSLGETDYHQRNVFHYAVTKPDVLKTLLEKFKTDPTLKIVLQQEDKDGQTAIHRASILGNNKSLEILYEHDNALMKQRSKVNKRCVLHFAVISYSTITIQFVLNKDAGQINMADDMSRTPAHFAATENKKHIIALLLSKGADPMRKDIKGQLPIHAAASKGLLNVVQLLLKDNPSCIDCIDNTKQTPLILAAKNGCNQVVTYLLNEQADYELKDSSTFTAFDWGVKNGKTEVIEVFLNKDYWKKIILGSTLGPEMSLATLVESVPDTSLILLDKCIKVEGTMKNPENYKVKYDFFCLEPKDEAGRTFRAEALLSMVENKREQCLSHPLCVKYVSMKWKQRGFKYNLAAILLAVLFHTCLMIFTTRIRGVATIHKEKYMVNGKNESRNIPERNAARPDDEFMMALRIIMLITMIGTMLKELYQMIKQRTKYFLQLNHYIQWTLCITVLIFLLPVEKKITSTQVGSGSICLFLSWGMLVHFLRMVPVLGVHIMAVEKVFWSLMKISVVVFIFLLSFGSTFYIILEEYKSYHEFGVAIVSTFLAMLEGPNYETHFVAKGMMHPELYELKMIILVIFIVVMAIVVNNTLIGLAVGDTDEVMKSAKFEKFQRKALFVIHLEKTVNSLPWFHIMGNECLIEYPGRKKKFYEVVLDFVYLGGQYDMVDGVEDEKEVESDGEEWEITLEEHFEKLLSAKMENLRSELSDQMKENHKEDIAKWKEMEEKIEKMLEK